MKKLFYIFSTVLMLFCMLIVNGFALQTNSNDRDRVVDEAEIIDDISEKQLRSKVDEYSRKYKCDIVVVTASDIGQKTSQSYADDYFDYNGYGFGENNDGIILLISMNPKQVAISTSGKFINYFSNEDCDDILDNIINDLKSERYEDAAIKFADNVGSGLKSIKTRPLKLIIVALGIGFVIASIIVSSMKSKLKTIYKRNSAVDYVVDNSMNITRSHDRFLYNNITRTKIEKQSGSSGGTHTSSSGHSHGGASRSF